MSKNVNTNFDSIVIDSNSIQFSLERNKFFKAIIMAYFMNTRQVGYAEAARFFRNFEEYTPQTDQLIQEYYSYIQGRTITEGFIDNKISLGAPKYKLSMIESQLELKIKNLTINEK